MSFTFTEHILTGLGLENPTLEMLVPDTNNYHALLYQHKGSFNPTPTHFGNQDSVTAHTEFMSVVCKARELNCSLLMTPEYSCPWSVVEQILGHENLQPSQQKLWALGCESITPDTIRALKAGFAHDTHVVVHFDENALNGPGHFLDAMCYIFKTATVDGELKTICLVQFKTQHMGVWQNPIENENYIPGQEIYIFRNEPESIYLFTLICSEALTFNVNQEFTQQTGHRWQTQPYVILNLQLNPSPNHEDFRSFKSRVLSYERKEIITLNWANGSNDEELNWFEMPYELRELIERIGGHQSTAKEGLAYIPFKLNGKVYAIWTEHVERSRGVTFTRLQTCYPIERTEKLQELEKLYVEVPVDTKLSAFIKRKT